MGQGVAVTRLQMAMAVGAIANGGVLMRPMLVKRLRTPTATWSNNINRRSSAAW